jgi:hypothetical protein
MYRKLLRNFSTENFVPPYTNMLQLTTPKCKKTISHSTENLPRLQKRVTRRIKNRSRVGRHGSLGNWSDSRQNLNYVCLSTYSYFDDMSCSTPPLQWLVLVMADTWLHSTPCRVQAGLLTVGQ